MAVKLLRLKSSEDIIGDVVSENSEFVTVSNPAMLMPMGDPRGGNVQVGLAPWLPFSDQKDIDFPRDFILVITDAVQDIVNNYNQVFGSGIVVPQVKVDKKTLLQE
jgi:hypothetical protein